MLTWFKRLTDVRQGEAAWVVGAFLAQFGVVAGHTTLETARDALFLSRLPPSRLAIVYVGVALGTVVLSAVNARLVRSVGQRNAFLITLVIGAYGTTLLYFQRMTEALLFVLYGWSALLGALLVMQFWLFAGQVFTVTQGKRLFGLVASGGTVGAVGGGAMSAAVLPFFATRALLLVGAGFFLATALVFTAMPVGGAEPAAASSTASREDRSEPGVVATLRRTPYLARMAVFTASGTATVLLVDYLFKTIAAARVPHQDLGLFFARTSVVLNLIGLAVQLLLTGRLLRALGVVPALMFLPLCIALGTWAIAALGGLVAFALFTKGADGGLRYSLHRVASELLWMPLSSDVQTRAKGLIDTVFGKITQAAVAAVLLVLVAAGLHSPRVVASLALGFTALWIGSIVLLRGPYVDLFRKALARGDLELGVATGELDRTSIEAILEALASESAVRVTHAMELLHERKQARLIPAIILYHEDEAVLVRALDLAATPDRKDWQRLATRLLGHASETVRIAAIRALSRAGEYEAVKGALVDVSPAVRAHALLLGAIGDGAEQAVFDLLRAEGRPSNTLRRALLDAIRERPEARWSDLVLELARDADAETADHAAKAMSRIADPRFVPWLIPRLGTRAGRGSMREALVRQGEPALDALAQAVLDPATPENIRLHLPRTISRFGSQRAADLLLDMLTIEPRGAVRYKALRGLGRLSADSAVKVDPPLVERVVRTNLIEALRLVAFSSALADPSPSAALEIIVAILGDKRRQAVERAFRLLQIVHKNEDIEGVSRALGSEDKRLRAHALEFLEQLTAVTPRQQHRSPLDASTRKDIRELLAILGEDLPDSERVARGERFLEHSPQSPGEALSMLALDPDPVLAGLSAQHARELGTARAASRPSRAPGPSKPEAMAFLRAPDVRPRSVETRSRSTNHDFEQQLFLRELSFGRLVGAAAGRLVRHSADMDVDAGTTLYSAGTPVNDVLFIVSGEVELRSETLPTRRMAAPAALGVVDGMDTRVHERTAVTMTPVRAFGLPLQDWLDMVEEDFELAHAGVVTVAEDLAAVTSELPPDGGFSPPHEAPTAVPELEITERILLLRALGAFQFASVEGIARIAVVSSERRAAAGETLHAQGGPSSEILVVGGGTVLVRRQAPAIEARFGPGQVVGGSASFGVREHQFTATAETSVTLLSIRREDLADVMEDHFDVFRSVMIAIGRESTRATARAELLRASRSPSQAP